MEKDSTSSKNNHLGLDRNTKENSNEEHITMDNAMCNERLLRSDKKVSIPEDIHTSELEPVSDGHQLEQTEPPDGGWGWVIVVGVGMALGINAGFNKSVTLFYEQVLMRFRRSAAVTAGLASTSGTLRMVLSMYLISTILLLHRKSPKVDA